MRCVAAASRGTGALLLEWGGGGAGAGAGAGAAERRGWQEAFLLTARAAGLLAGAGPAGAGGGGWGGGRRGVTKVVDGTAHVGVHRCVRAGPGRLRSRVERAREGAGDRAGRRGGGD